MRKFRDYKVWQRAMDLVEAIYRISAMFPKEELYGLTNQLRRAAVSVPLNIAEGAGTTSDKDFGRFLAFALRSVYETMTALELAERLSFCPPDTTHELLEEADEIAAMLAGLQKRLGGGTYRVAEEAASYEALDDLDIILRDDEAQLTNQPAEG